MLIRILDVLGALFGLVVASPLMLICAGAVWMESGRPILFTQQRVGRNNTLFTIYKFRTMQVGTPDLAKDRLANHMRSHVTRVGRWLRRTSLDELPQLFNVLGGEMSLVGPRPALYNQYDLIEMRTAARVHKMRPGLTGLAQVMGREDMPLDVKVGYDRQLMETFGLKTYVQIILRTVTVLWQSRGTY